MTEGQPRDLPERIRERLEALLSDVHSILAQANGLIVEPLPDRLAFRFEGQTGGDILEPYVRAQSISFITRFENLPEGDEISVVEDGGRHFIGNLHHVRHVLNDYRPIVQNQSDSTYYRRVHNKWAEMLAETDRTRRTTIRAKDADGADCTPAFIRWLGQHAEAIAQILNALDFDYLYNGVLQHSDPRFTARFMSDYQSGELNWLYWKHMLALSEIRLLLYPYYRLMQILTFPSMGPL